MKRGWIAGLISMLLFASPFVPAVQAAPAEHLQWGGELHSGASACPRGRLAVNVVQKVTNDADSGIAGNTWALDDFVRQIQVVETAPNTFCATVTYEGSFTTLAGTSPGGTGTVGAGIVGTFQGGYVTGPFTAALEPADGIRTRGSIGTFDYECDAAGNCPDYVDWTTLYFGTAGVPLVQQWWGWVYHAGANGSWVNAISGNSGDITGE